MKRKRAGLINGEYVEWVEDKGPARAHGPSVVGKRAHLGGHRPYIEARVPCATPPGRPEPWVSLLMWEAPE